MFIFKLHITHNSRPIHLIGNKVNMWHNKAELRRKRIRLRVRNYRMRKKMELEAARGSDSSTSEENEPPQEVEEAMDVPDDDYGYRESLEGTSTAMQRTSNSSRPLEQILRTDLIPISREEDERRVDHVQQGQQQEEHEESLQRYLWTSNDQESDQNVLINLSSGAEQEAQARGDGDVAQVPDAVDVDDGGADGGGRTALPRRF